MSTLDTGPLPMYVPETPQLDAGPDGQHLTLTERSHTLAEGLEPDGMVTPLTNPEAPTGGDSQIFDRLLEEEDWSFADAFRDAHDGVEGIRHLEVPTASAVMGGVLGRHEEALAGSDATSVSEADSDVAVAPEAAPEQAVATEVVTGISEPATPYAADAAPIAKPRIDTTPSPALQKAIDEFVTKGTDATPAPVETSVMTDAPIIVEVKPAPVTYDDGKEMAQALVDWNRDTDFLKGVLEPDYLDPKNDDPAPVSSEYLEQLDQHEHAPAALETPKPQRGLKAALSGFFARTGKSTPARHVRPADVPAVPDVAPATDSVPLVRTRSEEWRRVRATTQPAVERNTPAALPRADVASQIEWRRNEVSRVDRTTRAAQAVTATGIAGVAAASLFTGPGNLVDAAHSIQGRLSGDRAASAPETATAQAMREINHLSRLAHTYQAGPDGKITSVLTETRAVDGKTGAEVAQYSTAANPADVTRVAVLPFMGRDGTTDTVFAIQRETATGRPSLVAVSNDNGLVTPVPVTSIQPSDNNAAAQAAAQAVATVLASDPHQDDPREDRRAQA